MRLERKFFKRLHGQKLAEKDVLWASLSWLDIMKQTCEYQH